MKNLIKFAMGAAIAGALVNLLMKQRAAAMSREDQAFDDNVGLGEDEFVEGIEVVTLSGDMIGGERAPEPFAESRDEWNGRQAGDAPTH